MNPPEVFGALSLAVAAFNRSLAPLGANRSRRTSYRRKQLEKWQKHLARAAKYLSRRAA